MTARKMMCDYCGDVIGVYEPMVLVIDHEVHQTSRAAMSVTPSDADGRYHRACYVAWMESASSPDPFAA